MVLTALILLVLWAGSGLYAQRVVQQAEQLTLTSALLQGPLWLHRALIWSTKEAPAAAVADASASLDSVGDGPASTAEDEQGDDQAGESGETAAREEKVPARPLFATVKTQCPQCREETKHDREGVCKSCGQPNNSLRQAWGLATVDATEEVSVEEATIVSSLPVEQAPEPERVKHEVVELDRERELEPFDALPDRPRFGKVKTVCPRCRERTKHDREAVCTACGERNEWLAKRWELAPLGEQVRYEPVIASPTASDHPDTGKSSDEAQVELAAAGENLQPGRSPSPMEREAVGQGESLPDEADEDGQPAADSEALHVAEPVEVAEDAGEVDIPLELAPLAHLDQREQVDAAFGAEAAEQHEAVAQPEAGEQPPSAADSLRIDPPVATGRCPTCSRRRLADYFGKCVFCGADLPEEES